MNEALLQFIWKFRYFNTSSLCTTEDEPLQILHSGTLNSNQGPDFLEAKIMIGNTIWMGNVELHVNSSDWEKHHHQSDKNYKNIILHVVWKHDKELSLRFPTLELQNVVPKFLLKKYEGLMQSVAFIPCEKEIAQVDEFIFSAWKERLLVERLQDKTQIVFEFLKQNKNHWEETFWWILAKNFGAKVNSEAFQSLAQSISVNILAKHKQQIHQIEALIFGQAGLLEEIFSEDYPLLLQKEYQFLKKKYQLKPIPVSLHFSKMRPSNFPTVRLAQLAMLVHQSLHLFSKIRETNSLDDIREMLDVTANDYWHYHYILDELSSYKVKKLGRQMVDNILVNTIIPVVFSYGSFHQEQEIKNRSLHWLQLISAEKNTIIRSFDLLGIKTRTAFDTQALIQMNNQYCSPKRCLQCAIGAQLLGKNRVGLLPDSTTSKLHSS